MEDHHKPADGTFFGDDGRPAAGDGPRGSVPAAQPRHVFTARRVSCAQQALGRGFNPDAGDLVREQKHLVQGCPLRIADLPTGERAGDRVHPGDAARRIRHDDPVADAVQRGEELGQHATRGSIGSIGIRRRWGGSHSSA